MDFEFKTYDFFDSNKRMVIFEKHNANTVLKIQEKFQKKILNSITEISNDLYTKSYKAGDYVILSSEAANLFQQNMEEGNDKT